MIAESGIDVALRMGFHELPAFDMAQACRKLLDACPTCQFAGLQPGKTYVYKAPYGNHVELLVIGEVTAKRTQAVASVNGSAARRIYRGSYPGTFSELDADLIALSPVKHEEVVKAAVERGLAHAIKAFRTIKRLRDKGRKRRREGDDQGEGVKPRASKRREGRQRQPPSSLSRINGSSGPS